MKTVLALLTAVTFLLPGCGSASGPARAGDLPESFRLQDRSFGQIDRRVLKEIDRASLLAQDQERGKSSARPLGFAVAEDVSFDLDNSGTWRDLPNGRLWRLVIQAPSAVSLNLGFSRFEMPEGAKLWVYDPARTRVEGPYTTHNRSPQGRLWTPIINGEQIVVEVFVPVGANMPSVTIGSANKGYRPLN